MTSERHHHVSSERVQHYTSIRGAADPPPADAEIELQVQLIWGDPTDLDAHSKSQYGHIYWENKRGRGHRLHIDINARASSATDKAVENIYYTRDCLDGVFTISVHNYTSRNYLPGSSTEVGPTPFAVHVFRYERGVKVGEPVSYDSNPGSIDRYGRGLVHGQEVDVMRLTRKDGQWTIEVLDPKLGDTGVAMAVRQPVQQPSGVTPTGSYLPAADFKVIAQQPEGYPVALRTEPRESVQATLEATNGTKLRVKEAGTLDGIEWVGILNGDGKIYYAKRKNVIDDVPKPMFAIIQGICNR